MSYEICRQVDPYVCLLEHPATGKGALDTDEQIVSVDI